MIRLATVIGHGLNLLPHFIKHYENDVDEIVIGVYKTNLYPNIEEDIEEIIKDNKKVRIEYAHKHVPFDWERVTRMYNMIISNEPDDYWVIADIDEFHLYSRDRLYYIVDQCRRNNWEIVRGGFIDRIGENGEFSEIKPNIDLFQQFPYAGFFRYPMSNACPNKVCIVKGNVEITSGQHYAKINGQTTWRWQGWNHPLIAPYEQFSVQVHHFKWDSTAIERIKAVSDVNEARAYSDEYRIMYDKLEKSLFRINLNNQIFMFEKNTKKEFGEYSQWNKLLKNIISI